MELKVKHFPAGSLRNTKNQILLLSFANRVLVQLTHGVYFSFLVHTIVWAWIQAGSFHLKSAFEIRLLGRGKIPQAMKQVKPNKSFKFVPAFGLHGTSLRYASRSPLILRSGRIYLAKNKSVPLFPSVWCALKLNSGLPWKSSGSGLSFQRSPSTTLWQRALSALLPKQYRRIATEVDSRQILVTS